MNVAIILLLLAQNPSPKPPITLKLCHDFIGSVISSDLSNTSLSTIGTSREILGRCVAEHGEEMDKTELMGAFVSLQLFDNELSKRMQKESEALIASLNQAKKECAYKTK